MSSALPPPSGPNSGPGPGANSGSDRPAPKRPATKRAPKPPPPPPPPRKLGQPGLTPPPRPAAPALPPAPPPPPAPPRQFTPRPTERPPLKHPRKVRGGVRLTGDAPGTGSWAAQRWVRLMEQAAPGQAMVEGLEYARLGQTRTLTISPGRVVASVQGRADRPYHVTVTVESFPESVWNAALDTMSAQALHAAKILSGELPPSIEDLFMPLGLKLVPTEPAEATPACSCTEERPEGNPWCKHACCAGFLLAEKLSTDARTVFPLRGMTVEALLEHLRDRRLAAGMSAVGASPVYAPRVERVSDVTPPTLETSLESFWEAGPGLRTLSTPIDAPNLSHPLLRRLGPSPFPGATFPLVGLLATCYDVMSEGVIRAETQAPAPASDANEGDAGADEDPDDAGAKDDE